MKKANGAATRLPETAHVLSYQPADLAGIPHVEWESCLFYLNDQVSVFAYSWMNSRKRAEIELFRSYVLRVSEIIEDPCAEKLKELAIGKPTLKPPAVVFCDQTAVQVYLALGLSRCDVDLWETRYRNVLWFDKDGSFRDFVVARWMDESVYGSQLYYECQTADGVRGYRFGENLCYYKITKSNLTRARALEIINPTTVATAYRYFPGFDSLPLARKKLEALDSADELHVFVAKNASVNLREEVLFQYGRLIPRRRNAHGQYVLGGNVFGHATSSVRPAMTFFHDPGSGTWTVLRGRVSFAKSPDIALADDEIPARAYFKRHAVHLTRAEVPFSPGLWRNLPPHLDLIEYIRSQLSLPSLRPVLNTLKRQPRVRLDRVFVHSSAVALDTALPAEDHEIASFWAARIAVTRLNGVVLYRDAMTERATFAAFDPVTWETDRDMLELLEFPFARVPEVGTRRFVSSAYEHASDKDGILKRWWGTMAKSVEANEEQTPRAGMPWGDYVEDICLRGRSDEDFGVVLRSAGVPYLSSTRHGYFIIDDKGRLLQRYKPGTVIDKLETMPGETKYLFGRAWEHQDALSGLDRRLFYLQRTMRNEPPQAHYQGYFEFCSQDRSYTDVFIKVRDTKEIVQTTACLDTGACVPFVSEYILKKVLGDNEEALSRIIEPVTDMTLTSVVGEIEILGKITLEVFSPHGWSREIDFTVVRKPLELLFTAQLSHELGYIAKPDKLPLVEKEVKLRTGENEIGSLKEVSVDTGASANFLTTKALKAAFPQKLPRLLPSLYPKECDAYDRVVKIVGELRALVSLQRTDGLRSVYTNWLVSDNESDNFALISCNESVILGLVEFLKPDNGIFRMGKSVKYIESKYTFDNSFFRKKCFSFLFLIFYFPVARANSRRVSSSSCPKKHRPCCPDAFPQSEQIRF